MLSSKGKGILAIVASAFGFALMALCVRLCDDYGGAVNSFQKSFFRNAIAFVIALAVYLKGRTRRGRETRDVRRESQSRTSTLMLLALLSARSVFGTIGIFANFYALSHIPIAEGQTLNKTAPFFTVIFAYLFLKERVSLKQLGALGLAFFGVLLIAKPGFAGADAFPLAMGLLGGVGAGAAYVCVRTMRTRGLDSAFIILFFSAFSCLASVPFLLAGLDPMTWRQVLILLGAGAGAAIGQFGVTLAYGYAAPRDIAVYDYTNILFTAAFGYLFFSQVPDAWSVLGFAAILVAAWRMNLTSFADRKNRM